MRHARSPHGRGSMRRRVGPPERRACAWRIRDGRVGSATYADSRDSSRSGCGDRGRSAMKLATLTLHALFFDLRRLALSEWQRAHFAFCRQRRCNRRNRRPISRCAASSEHGGAGSTEESAAGRRRRVEGSKGRRDRRKWCAEEDWLRMQHPSRLKIEFLMYCAPHNGKFHQDGSGFLNVSYGGGRARARQMRHGRVYSEDHRRA